MRVTTEFSVYEFADGYVTRYPAGLPLRRDGERSRVLCMDPVVVGEPMVMVLAGISSRPEVVTCRATSNVLGIENGEAVEHLAENKGATA
jgi:hypothetical protein